MSVSCCTPVSLTALESCPIRITSFLVFPQPLSLHSQHANCPLPINISLCQAYSRFTRLNPLNIPRDISLEYQLFSSLSSCLPDLSSLCPFLIALSNVLYPLVNHLDFLLDLILVSLDTGTISLAPGHPGTQGYCHLLPFSFSRTSS